MMEKVKSKTFCEDFTEQVEISERLYGSNIHFSFSYDDIKEIVNSAENYDEIVKNRVIEIIMQMRRKYGYLFKNTLISSTQRLYTSCILYFLYQSDVRIAQFFASSLGFQPSRVFALVMSSINK